MASSGGGDGATEDRGAVGEEQLPAWAQAWFGPWLWERWTTSAVPSVAAEPPVQAEAQRTVVRGAEQAKMLFLKDTKEIDAWDRTRYLNGGEPAAATDDEGSRQARARARAKMRRPGEQERGGLLAVAPLADKELVNLARSLTGTH